MPSPSRKRKPTNPFYGTQAWKQMRRRIIARDRGRCVICGSYVGNSGAARVDHIERLRDNPARALDPSNLRTLCTRCDAQGHRERGPSPSTTRIERFNYGIDASGLPLDPKHHWYK